MIGFLISCRIVSYTFLIAAMWQQVNEAPGEPLATSPRVQAELVQGIARFSDGSLLADADLDVKLFRLDVSASEEEKLQVVATLRCNTDAEGQFQFPLPAKERFSATVVASKWSDGNRGCWRSSIPALDEQLKDPIDLEFDNRGRIVIAFFGMANLTTESEIVLTCTPSGNSIEVRHTRRLGPDFRSPLILDGLEPREYKVEVNVPMLSGQAWTETVVVPAEAPYRALTKFHFPEFSFGTVEAQILLPDGKTLAAGKHFQVECVDEQGNSFGRKQLFTDSAGKLSAKIPAGEFRLSYIADRRREEDTQLAPAEFNVKVAADQSVQLGALRLKSVDEVFASFAGTIKYSSGESVENVYPLGQVWGYGHLLADNGGALMFDSKLTPSGYFLMHVTSGKQVVAVGLEGTDRLGGGLVSQVSVNKSVLFELDLKPGGRHRADVIIPILEQPRSLVINTDVEHGLNALVNVLVEIGPNTFWNARQVISGKTTVFEGIPEGEGYVVFQSDRVSYLAARKFPAFLGKHEIKFPQDQVGRLSVQLEDAERMQRCGFELYVSVDTPLRILADFHIAARGVAATEVEEQPTATENQRVSRSSNGALVVEGLAAGTYFVRVEDGDKQHERKVEVVRNETTSVQF